MSQGGWLSMRAALLAPDRVQALILLDTQTALDDDEKRSGNEAMIHIWLKDGPVDDLVAVVASVIVDDPVENPKWIAKWQASDEGLMELPARCMMDRDDISGRLVEITCPALAIHGTEDSGLSMEDAEQMAESLPGCEGVVKVNGAHAANLTNPEPVNEAILEFLGGLPS
jgi:pimeloyl-ACP methyl ester carboxylesterase